MNTATEWHAHFLGIMRNLKSAGWDRPTIMWGRVVRAPGVVDHPIWMQIANDN